jgi:hypothetical protein
MPNHKVKEYVEQKQCHNTPETSKVNEITSPSMSKFWKLETIM